MTEILVSSLPPGLMAIFSPGTLTGKQGGADSREDSVTKFDCDG